MQAESLDHLIAAGLQLLLSSGLEKSSSIPSLSTVLPYIAPFLLIISPFLLFGLIPSMFFTVLFIFFGILALTFLLPFILPLGGLMGAFFMDDDFFHSEKFDDFDFYSSDDFLDKYDILEPVYKAVTEATVTDATVDTIAEIVTNIPRMFF